MTEKEFARGWPREYKAVMKARKTEEALVVKEKAR